MKRNQMCAARCVTQVLTIMATDRPCHTFADGMNAHAPNPGGSIPFLPVERRRDIFVLFGEASTDALKNFWRMLVDGLMLATSHGQKHTLGTSFVDAPKQ